MWQLIRKQIRPNLEVNFFQQANNELISDEFKTYWVDTYVATDKCIYVSGEPSEDGLELTITMLWDSRESIDAMLNDPICHEGLFAVKAAYLAENQIQEFIVSSLEV